MMDVTYIGIRRRQEEGLILSRETGNKKGADLAGLEMLGKRRKG